MSVTILEICPGRGRELRLDGGFVIGRGPGCDVKLKDPLASRRHARVVSAAVGTAIEDLGSSNGIHVNGRRTHGITPLHPGDVIQIGATVWLVRPGPDGQLLGAIDREPTA
jgi:pSer/pThr/pTyr-binding forkhead associated (FHA) protein